MIAARKTKPPKTPKAMIPRDSAEPAESRSDCSPLDSSLQRLLESFAHSLNRGSRCRWVASVLAPASAGNPSSSASEVWAIQGRSRLASWGKDLVRKAVSSLRYPRYHFLALSSWDH